MQVKFRVDAAVDRFLCLASRTLFVRPLMALGVTPNQVTFFSTAFCGAAVIYLFAQNSYAANIGAVGFLLLNGLLDSLDGELARARGLGSNLGAWFDNMCDYVLQCVTLVGLTLGIVLHSGEAIPLASCLVALASQAIMVRYTDIYGGLFERRDEFWRRCNEEGISRWERVAAHIISADSSLMVVLSTYRYPLLLCLIIDESALFMAYLGAAQFLRCAVLHAYVFKAWQRKSPLGAIVCSLVLENGIGSWPQIGSPADTEQEDGL